MRRLLPIAALLLCACGPSSKGTWSDMRSSACTGDSAGFWSHVDRTNLVEHVTRDALTKAESEQPKGKKGTAAGAAAANLLLPLVRAAVEKEIASWDDDMKKGKGGSLCGMQLGDSIDNPQGGWVNFKTPSGDSKRWEFTKFGDKLLLTNILKQ